MCLMLSLVRSLFLIPFFAIKNKEKELNKVSKIINKIFKDKMNKVMKTRDKNKIVEYFSKNDNM